MTDTPTTYGVWLEGRGWLANEHRRAFASTDRAVAETAAALWGKGASVMAMDSSLVDLQDFLLAHQAAVAPQRKGWRAWLTWTK